MGDEKSVSDALLVGPMLVDTVEKKKTQLKGESQELIAALAAKNLMVHYVEGQYCDSLYSSVAFAISQFPPPFNVSYPVQVLRHKTSQYILANPGKFIKNLGTVEMLRKYCDCVATTMNGTSETEALALAYALQIKIQVHHRLRLSVDGFIIEEHGDSYCDIIKLAYLPLSKEFVPLMW